MDPNGRARPIVPSFLALTLIAACASLVMGCGRRGAEHAPAQAEADTLSNGLPRALVPKLEEWVAAWRQAISGFTPESLTCVSRVPFQFQSAQAGGGLKYVESVRSRAGILVLSPDSATAVDFDRYLDFDDGEGGFGIEREPDSAPMLLDFAGDTLWTVDFCGTSCFYDGGYWADARRFALTGATRSGDQYDGPWQAFLEIRDLRTREASRWLASLVEDAAFERYQMASDSALLARITRARSQPDSLARSN